MLILAAVLFAIDTIITVYVMITLCDLLILRSPKSISIIASQLLVNPVFAFMMNLFVSSLIAVFTGEGMISGLANLGSSVLIGVCLPPYLNYRYKIGR